MHSVLNYITNCAGVRAEGHNIRFWTNAKQLMYLYFDGRETAHIGKKKRERESQNLVVGIGYY